MKTEEETQAEAQALASEVAPAELGEGQEGLAQTADKAAELSEIELSEQTAGGDEQVAEKKLSLKRAPSRRTTELALTNGVGF